MVAAERFRKAEGVEAHAQAAPPALKFDTVNMTVKDLRALIALTGQPDVRLLCGLTRDPRVTVRDMAYAALRSGRSLAANEDLFREEGLVMIAGADEAGRGALAGPLVAAAVMFEPGSEIDGVDDSKALAPSRREELYEEILREAVSVSVASIDATLIDRWGLQTVNLKALADALEGIHPRCDIAICDHFRPAGLACRSFGIPHADEIFHSVAAASIVAKVERDRLMRSMHRRFTSYNFEGNKGYGSEEHLGALARHGPCEMHRLSFSGVREPGAQASLWGSRDGP